MSDTKPEVTPAQQVEPIAPAGTSGFTAPTTQEEFDAMVKDRLSREKAKYADYSDLKAKATEFDKLADAQKTETQRANDRADAAEKALQEKSSEALRLSVIARHSIPEEYQDFITGATEEELTEKAEKFQTLIATQKPDANGRELFVPSEGRSPSNALANDPATALANFLKNARGR